jgi:hypothetical protein
MASDPKWVGLGWVRLRIGFEALDLGTWFIDIIIIIIIHVRKGGWDCLLACLLVCLFAASKEAFWGFWDSDDHVAWCLGMARKGYDRQGKESKGKERSGSR